MSHGLGGAAARVVVLGVTLLGLGACAAQSKVGASPEAASAPPAGSPQAGYAQQPGYPAASTTPQQPGAYPPAPAPAPEPAPATPGGGSTMDRAQQRAAAIQSASSQIDTSQRELDVSSGNCVNACRALGSMDRAAGKLCELALGDGEGRRCDDAKSRVYSARARVKTTCGGCPNGPSVERADPIPSVR